MTLLESILSDGVDRIRVEAIERSRQAGQEATSRTYSMMRVESESRETGATARLLVPPQFVTLIRGRGPGAVPANFAQVIAEWAGYKGLSFPDQASLMRFARAVAHKIASEGSELYVNRLYLDIIDTPIREFEDSLQDNIATELHQAVRSVLNPREGLGNRGFIL